jgi:type II secretory pathway pseudopilin PulG
MKCRKGLTLVEIIVAIAVFAASILIIVSIIPTGVLSLRKAGDYQSATAYGMSLIEEIKSARPDYADYPVTDLDMGKSLNNSDFQFQRDIYAIDAQIPHRLFDVIVTVTWQKQQQPLRLATRVYIQE